MTQGRGLISAMGNMLQNSREKCTLLELAQQRCNTGTNTCITSKSEASISSESV